MNKTILFSDGPSSDDKNKTILITVIVCIIVFLSLIIFLYIYIKVQKKEKKQINLSKNSSLILPKKIEENNNGVFRKLQTPADPFPGQALQGSPGPEPTLWRNAIIENEINLGDIYRKETNKRLVVNPLV